MFQKVNYTGIAGSAEFIKYKRLTQELVRVHVESATREEKIAFFINIYNALVVHANIVKGPPGNLWQRYKVRLLHTFSCANQLQSSFYME